MDASQGAARIWVVGVIVIVDIDGLSRVIVLKSESLSLRHGLLPRESELRGNLSR